MRQRHQVGQTARRIDDGPQPALVRRPLEDQGQRQHQEEHAGREDREAHAAAQDPQLPLVAAQKRPGEEEEVERHVGKDQRRDEGDRQLPLEPPGLHVGALVRDPVRAGVNRHEEQREQQRRLARSDHQGPTRRASDTVKMPHGSISWESLANPAVCTSSSISACERRRMIHGWPSRLVRTRAMNSTCGCHG